MKSLLIIVSVAVCNLVFMPAGIHAQSAPGDGGQPPVAQPLVREGDLATNLVEALKLGTATSETEAESMLGNAGITPRNGWIADYPVTPDVIGELTKSISDAVDSDRLDMDKEEALKAFQDVTTRVNLTVRSSTSEQTGPSDVTTPNTTVINNYYYDQGPPVVTYYAPPPDYVYLYTWVPYPFWGWDFWFPGFYILVDFHRVVHVHDRDDHDRHDHDGYDHDRYDHDRHGHDRQDHDRVEVISNHFVDHQSNRVVRNIARSQSETKAENEFARVYDALEKVPLLHDIDSR